MPKRKTRAIVFGGAGNAGTQILKALHERGAQIVGVLERRNLGEDVGVHAGVGELGVVFEDADVAAEVIARSKPDIALVAIGTEYAVVMEALVTCLERGVNVITIAEDTYLPAWREEDKPLVEQLDQLARANGATLLSTGMQDWSQQLIVTNAAAMQNLTEIREVNHCMLDGAGDDVLKTIFVGLTPEEFDEVKDGASREISNGPLRSLAKDLGLTVTSLETRIEPIVAKSDHYAKLSDLTVSAGTLLGVYEETVMTTAEGVTVRTCGNTKLPEGDESDASEIELIGSNPLTIVTYGKDGFPNTGALCVSRIPDVLAAAPGYLSVNDMPRLMYKSNLTIDEA